MAEERSIPLEDVSPVLQLVLTRLRELKLLEGGDEHQLPISVGAMTMAQLLRGARALGLNKPDIVVGLGMAIGWDMIEPNPAMLQALAAKFIDGANLGAAAHQDEGQSSLFDA